MTSTLAFKVVQFFLSKEDVQKYVLLSGETENDGLICEFKDGLHRFFFLQTVHFLPSPRKILKLL